MKRSLLKTLLCLNHLWQGNERPHSIAWYPMTPLLFVSLMGLASQASAHPLPTESAWTLPAGQEAQVSKLMTIEGLPAPSSISIDKSRIIASYPLDRQLELRHPATMQGHKPLFASPKIAVFIRKGTFTEAEQTKIVAHIRNAQAPRWSKPKAQATARPRDPKDSSRRDQRDDRLDQAREAIILGESDKAQRLLESVDQDQGANAGQRVRLGELFVKLGQTERGQKILRQVVDALKKRADQDPSARASWVDALARLDPDQASKIANAEVVSANRPCDWSLIAYTLQDKQKRTQAAAIADAILKRQPKCEHAWLVKGHVADTGLKSWQAVLDVANAALKHLPQSLPLMNLKAGALHSGWKNKEAAEVWEEIARRDLNFPGVMGMLATAWTQLPEIENEDFLKPLEQRLQSKPDDVILRYIIGTASYYRDDFESVIRYLDPLRKVVPREPRVHLYTAMAHFHLGHTKTAFERLNTLQTFGHGDPDFYYCRSVMTRHTDFEGSLRDLETFVRLSQNRLNSDAKIYKMNRELEVMRSGRVPTKFDLLPPFARWGIILAALGLVFGGGVILWRRRRG